jgi:hypothetical protein
MMFRHSLSLIVLSVIASSTAIRTAPAEDLSTHLKFHMTQLPCPDAQAFCFHRCLGALVQRCRPLGFNFIRDSNLCITGVGSPDNPDTFCSNAIDACNTAC